MARIDDYVEALRRSLPADTREDLQEKMKADLGYPISIGSVDVALGVARWRAREGLQDWTVPHAKRGIPGWGEENRFYRLPANATARFALTEERRDNHDAGL